jgi:hypothetical protein
MQARELGKQLGLEVEKIGLEEAMRRQRSREQFSGAQALAAQAATLRPVQKVDAQGLKEETQKIGKTFPNPEQVKQLNFYYKSIGENKVVDKDTALSDYEKKITEGIS